MKAGLDLLPINIQKIQYGATDSKKAIATILNSVIPNYKFTTIGELNAVLNLYNVSANIGKEDSKMFLHKGLVYQIIDDDKKPVGVPIKASSFHFKPTLQYLEEKFEINKKTRLPDMKRIKNTIDLAFLKNTKPSLDELEKILIKEGIAVIYRTSPQHLIYGITYVDHTTKSIFNGSALGTFYAAKAIQQRCEISIADKNNPAFGKFKPLQDFPNLKDTQPFISESELQKIIDSILQPEYSPDYIPGQLKGKRRKRKRKGQSEN
ncbi:hypothetical protein DBR27_21510 [Flavobacterium sp. HMWF030]|nr:hypothetical protein DBR27_21510 [Flavobacterium sp. HMWF030]